MDFCNGNSWIQITGPAPLQPTMNSCLQIKTAFPSATDGLYTISGALVGTGLLTVYCDMTTNGGGWTLFSTKVTPTFLFISSAVNTNSYSTLASDTAGIIPPSATWSQVLFRFRNMVLAPAYTVYTKGGLAAFDNSMQGSGPGVNSVPCDGWWKFDASRGGRTPTSGTFTISDFFCVTSNGMSEQHANSDVWLDMWSASVDSASSYYVGEAACYGMKCIAGYCYCAEPIWLMYR